MRHRSAAYKGAYLLMPSNGGLFGRHAQAKCADDAARPQSRAGETGHALAASAGRDSVRQ